MTSIRWMGPWLLLIVLVAGVIIPDSVLADKGQYRNFHWSGSVPLQTFYESNIYHEVDNQVSDLGLRLSPKLSLSYNRPAWKIGWIGSNMYEQYFGVLSNEIARKRLIFSSTGEGNIRFVTGLRIGLKQQYIDTEEPLHAEIELDRRSIRRFRNLADVEVGQSLGAGRLGVSVRYLFFQDHYAEPAYRFLDAGKHTLQIKGKLKVFPKTAFFSELNTSRKSYRARERIDISEDHYAFDLVVGATGKWSPRMTGMAALGLKVVVFEESGIELSPTIRLDVQYTASSHTEYIGTFEHVFLDSTSALYFRTDSLRLQIQRKLSRSWKVVTDLKTAILRYGPPLERTDQATNLGGGLNFEPVAFSAFTAGLNYQYSRKDSTYDVVRYVAHGMEMNCTWSF